MKRTKLVISAIAIGICMVGLGDSKVIQPSPKVKAAKEFLDQNAYLYLKQEHQKINNNPVKPFVKINNKVFSNKEFDQFKESRNVIELNNGKQLLSDEQIKNEFIQNALLEEEAEKQNIVVTKNEAEAFAKQMRQVLQQSSDEYAKQLLQDYLSALGISEEEYWSQYAVPAYEKALKIGKLKAKFFEEQKAKDKNATFDDLNTAWEKYQQNLAHKAKVEFVQQ